MSSERAKIETDLEFAASQAFYAGIEEDRAIELVRETYDFERAEQEEQGER